MTVTVEEADTCKMRIFLVMHPEDAEKNRQKFSGILKREQEPVMDVGAYAAKGRELSLDAVRCPCCCLPLMRSAGYILHTDTKTIEEQEQLRRRYEEQLLEHYHKNGANELILGHSISRDRRQ